MILILPQQHLKDIEINPLETTNMNIIKLIILLTEDLNLSCIKETFLEESLEIMKRMLQNYTKL